MKDKIYCRDCRFCENRKCRRVPPQVIFISGGGRESNFPNCKAGDWCGMAEPREGADDCDCNIGETEKMKI